MAKPRKSSSSPTGAMIGPRDELEEEAGQLAGRRQRADGRDRGRAGRSTTEIGIVTRMTGIAQTAPPTHLADGPAIEAADAHLRPAQRAGVDDQEPDQSDVDERLDDDREELPERTVDVDARARRAAALRTMTATSDTGIAAMKTSSGDGPWYGRTPRARRSMPCEPAPATSPTDSRIRPASDQDDRRRSRRRTSRR